MQISEEKVRGATAWISSSARFAECAATVAVGTRELAAQKRRFENGNLGMVRKDGLPLTGWRALPHTLNLRVLATVAGVVVVT